jgi:hypothetical protein
MKVGDIVKIKYLPGSRGIIKFIGDVVAGSNASVFIYLENNSYPFFISELELHEDQIIIDNRLQKLNQIGI